LTVNRHYGEHVASVFRFEEKAKQETSVKAGGKQRNRLAKMSDYVGNRREIEESNSVPLATP
jgi:hypothetical protein